jgi:hypothetical protein
MLCLACGISGPPQARSFGLNRLFPAQSRWLNACRAWHSDDIGGLLLGYVALAWSSTPSTECVTKLAMQADDATEIGRAAHSVEVAFVQFTEIVVAPGIVPFIGYSDLACRWIPRSLIGLLAFGLVGNGMLLPLSRLRTPQSSPGTARGKGRRLPSVAGK